MSHWINSTLQIIGMGSGQLSDQATYIDFDTTIIGGSNPIVTGGAHQYSYHLNLSKPSGEAGPTRVGAGLVVISNGQPDLKLHTICRGMIDTWMPASLQHTGEIVLLANDTVQVAVWSEDDWPTTLIGTIPWTCSLSLRRVTGLGT